MACVIKRLKFDNLFHELLRSKRVVCHQNLIETDESMLNLSINIFAFKQIKQIVKHPC